MIDLRLLGSVSLEGASGADLTPVVRQPKRLALLAYLCLAARGQYCRRDTLLALFWPELDAARARGALRQALHFLRQHLGRDVVRARGDEELAIDPAHLRCDAALVDDALRSGRLEEAVARYGGELLDGVHLAGVDTELEHWLDAQRARLRDGVRQAVDALRRSADERGDLPAAVRWARRATELAPHDETAARRLMRRLAATGDRVGALAEYARIAATLRDLDGVEPSEQATALAAAIGGEPALETPMPLPIPRAGPRPAGASRPEAGRPDDFATLAVTGELPAVPRPPVVEPVTAPLPRLELPTPGRGAARRFAILGGAVALLAVGAVYATRARPPAPEATGVATAAPAASLQDADAARLYEEGRAHVARAEAHERAGELEAAVAQYRLALNAWRDAEAAMRAQREALARKVGALR